MKKILCILTAVCVLFAMSATGSMAGTIPAEDPAGAALQRICGVSTTKALPVPSPPAPCR